MGVYRWANDDPGDSYIGSSTNLSNRFKLYFSYNYISTPIRGKSIIYSALIKNGYSKFSLEILEYCDQDLVIERKQYFIDTFNPSYKLCKNAGNSLGRLHSEETKAKIAAKFLGRKHTDQARAKMKGRVVSDETLTKMRATTIYVYPSDSFTLVYTFASARKAAKFFDSHHNKITSHAQSGKLFKTQWILSMRPLY